MLSKLVDFPNTDTLCYHYYPFLTVYISSKRGFSEEDSKPRILRRVVVYLTYATAHV